MSSSPCFLTVPLQHFTRVMSLVSVLCWCPCSFLFVLCAFYPVTFCILQGVFNVHFMHFMHFVISSVYIQTIRLMELVRLAGRYRLQEELASGLSRMYRAIGSPPLILLIGLDTQTKYTLHATFCLETTSSLNSSVLKEIFTA